jgi:hypothetical protein
LRSEAEPSRKVGLGSRQAETAISTSGTRTLQSHWSQRRTRRPGCSPTQPVAPLSARTRGGGRSSRGMPRLGRGFRGSPTLFLTNIGVYHAAAWFGGARPDQGAMPRSPTPTPRSSAPPADSPGAAPDSTRCLVDRSSRRRQVAPTGARRSPSAGTARWIGATAPLHTGATTPSGPWTGTTGFAAIM